jgi:hypothetical protein
MKGDDMDSLTDATEGAVERRGLPRLLRRPLRRASRAGEPPAHPQALLPVPAPEKGLGDLDEIEMFSRYRALLTQRL